MRRLNWTAQSRRDLYTISNWLSESADGDVAVRIVTQIRDRADFLIDYPFAGASDQIDARRLRVPGTSYLILYRVLTADQIQIIRIRHVREDRTTSQPDE